MSYVTNINESCFIQDYSHEVEVDAKILAPNIVEGEEYIPIEDRSLGMNPAYRK